MGAPGVRVMSVAPAYVDTELLAGTSKAGGFTLDDVARRTPMGRLAEPREVARVVAFLASDEASFLTGSSVRVDGGWLADGGWEGMSPPLTRGAHERRTDHRDPEPLRLLALDGTLADGHVPALDGDELLDAWRAMLRSRVCDERCFSLQRQGRLGTFSPVNGEEAAVVGSAWALDPARDWIVPQYRELPRCCASATGWPRRCSTTRATRRQQHGRRRQRAAVPDLAGRADPARRRPGVGAAPAGPRCRRRHLLRRRRVVGGRSARGDEPRRRAPRSGRLRAEEQRLGHLHPCAQADRRGELRRPRAAGYGIAGELVDGNDLFAMHDACTRAVARARAGEGPTLIEARTYRMGPHNTSDDPTRYVDPVELEERRASIRSSACAAT
jgi:pyruvate dehydrogenase E1 component alpha subunit